MYSQYPTNQDQQFITGSNSTYSCTSSASDQSMLLSSNNSHRSYNYNNESTYYHQPQFSNYQYYSNSNYFTNAQSNDNYNFNCFNNNNNNNSQFNYNSYQPIHSPINFVNKINSAFTSTPNQSNFNYNMIQNYNFNSSSKNESKIKAADSSDESSLTTTTPLNSLKDLTNENVSTNNKRRAVHIERLDASLVIILIIIIKKI